MERVEDIFVVDKNSQDKELHIVCCLPGSNFSATFFKQWFKFVNACSKRNISLTLSSAEDGIVYYVRNKCLGGSVLRGKNQKPFNGKVDYDYMLWVDNDIIFSIKQFLRLLSWNVDIVSGVYMMKGGEYFATVKTWDEKYFEKHGAFQFLTKEDIAGYKDKNVLTEVAYTGFGFMLIKKGVFETLNYPWFEPIFYEIGNNIVDFCSEDVAFCKKAQKQGFKIYIDTSVRVGHEKRVIL